MVLSATKGLVFNRWSGQPSRIAQPNSGIGAPLTGERPFGIVAPGEVPVGIVVPSEQRMRIVIPSEQTMRIIATIGKLDDLVADLESDGWPGRRGRFRNRHGDDSARRERRHCWRNGLAKSCQ